MKLSSKLALLTASAGLLITSAFAATTSTATPAATNVTPKNSIYISGDAGFGALSTPDKNIEGPGIQSSSHDNGSFAGGADVGFNHALNNHVLLGAEFGYEYNGQSKYTAESFYNESMTAKISSWDLHLLATGTYLFTNGINVFGKVGAADVTQSLDLSGSAVTGDGNTSITQVKPMLAVGAGYRIKQVNIYAQYAHIFGKDAQTIDDLFNTDGSGTFSDVVTVDTFKLGLSYNIAI